LYTCEEICSEIKKQGRQQICLNALRNRTSIEQEGGVIAGVAGGGGSSSLLTEFENDLGNIVTGISTEVLFQCVGAVVRYGETMGTVFTDEDLTEDSPWTLEGMHAA
jgi:hypothetical protein